MFTLKVIVRNQGAASSSTTTLKYYRSADWFITMGEDYAGAVEIPALDESGSIDESIILTAPSAPGTYRYGVCVDPVDGEFELANNCSDAVAVVVLPRPADLLADGVTVDNDSLTAGQVFTVSVVVQNLGMRARASTLRFYRSIDSTISSDDDFEGALYVSALNEFERTNESMPFMALPTPGTYYYGACVDPVRGESDTTNNCSDAIAITVIPPTPTPEVVSKSESFSIKGVMIGPDDRTVTDTALSVWRGGRGVVGRCRAGR